MKNFSNTFIIIIIIITEITLLLKQCTFMGTVHSANCMCMCHAQHHEHVPYKYAWSNGNSKFMLAKAFSPFLLI